VYDSHTDLEGAGEAVDGVLGMEVLDCDDLRPLQGARKLLQKGVNYAR